MAGFEDPTAAPATPPAGPKDLYVLCGGGATARVVEEELIRTGRRFVVVEKDPATCERLRGVLPPESVVEGDATDEAVLARAGVREARGLLAMLREDKLNLVVVVTALQLQPSLRVVASGHDESQWERLRRAGAIVVSAAHISGRRLATGLIHPEASGFLNEMLTAPSERPIRIEAVLVTPEGGAAGRTLGALEIYRHARVQVIALCRGADGSFAYNPADATRVEAGDRLICIGDFERVDRLAALVGRWE